MIKFTKDEFMMMIEQAMIAPPMPMGMPVAGTASVGNPSMGMGGNPMIQQLIERSRQMRQGQV
jgi:hypothetical protein